MFSHCTMEVLRMRGLKGEIWKVGIVIAGMLLLLMLVIWIPRSAAKVMAKCEAHTLQAVAA